MVALSVLIRLLSVAQVEEAEEAAVAMVAVVATTLVGEEEATEVEVEVGIVCSYHLSLLPIPTNHFRRRRGLWTRWWRWRLLRWRSRWWW